MQNSTNTLVRAPARLTGGIGVRTLALTYLTVMLVATTAWVAAALVALVVAYTLVKLLRGERTLSWQA